LVYPEHVEIPLRKIQEEESLPANQAIQFIAGDPHAVPDIGGTK
jgi:hypothetical protein